MDKYLPHGQFAALGDPTRLAVVEALLQGPATVSELAEPFDMQLPPFTKHLKVLESAGLITTIKRGRVRTCSINQSVMMDLDQWFSTRRSSWEHRLDRLEQHLDSKHR